MVYSTRKVIDWELGANLFGGNRQSAEEMLEQLCQQLPSYKEQLITAWEMRDLEKLQQVTHKFYGGLCYCPTPCLKEATKNLESKLRESTEIKDLENYFIALCDAIQDVVNAKAVEWKCCDI